MNDMTIEVLENPRQVNRVRSIAKLLKNGYYEEPFMIVVANGTSDGICDEDIYEDNLYEGGEALDELTQNEPYATELLYPEDIFEAVSNGENICLNCDLLYTNSCQMKSALAQSGHDYHLIVNGDIGFFESDKDGDYLPGLDPAFFYYFKGGVTIVTDFYKGSYLEKYFNLFGFKPDLNGSLYIG